VKETKKEDSSVENDWAAIMSNDGSSSLAVSLVTKSVKNKEQPKGRQVNDIGIVRQISSKQVQKD
jgi:hypothetical protein